MISYREAAHVNRLVMLAAITGGSAMTRAAAQRGHDPPDFAQRGLAHAHRLD